MKKNEDWMMGLFAGIGFLILVAWAIDLFLRGLGQ